METLGFGPTYSLTQNVAYALPVRGGRIQVSPDTATVTVSVDDSDYDTLTLTGGSAALSGRFIKTSTASVKVTLTPN